MAKQPSILITGAQGSGKSLLTRLIASCYDAARILQTSLKVFNNMTWTLDEYIQYDLIIIEEIKDYPELATAHAKCISLFAARPMQLVFTSQADLNTDNLKDFLVVRACYNEYIPQPLM